MAQYNDIPIQEPFHYSINEFKKFLDLNKIKYKKKVDGFPDMRLKEINVIHLNEKNKKYIEYLNNHINNLTTFINMNQKYKKDKQNQTCLICYENSDSLKGFVNLKCNHTLCASCFANHMRENNNCPFCRFEICDKPKKIIQMPVEMLIQMVNICITRNLTSREGLTMFEYIKKQVNNIVDLEKDSIQNNEYQKEIYLKKIFYEIKQSFQDIIYDVESYYMSFS